MKGLETGSDHIMAAQRTWIPQLAVTLALLTWVTSTVTSNTTLPMLHDCADFQTSGIFNDNTLQGQFLLFTPKNPTCAELIQVNETLSIENSAFNATLDTKILIHGFRALGTKPSWVGDMVKSLLAAEAVNVVVVDWVCGATAKYNQAVENVPRLSREVEALIRRFLDLGSTEESFHLIGVSLGAHVAGYVGHYFGGRIGRITGLDPAGYKFTYADPEERLDPGDAIFVEAVHTDTDNFGIRIPVGHVDYFINGGRDQPGCPSIRRRVKYLPVTSDVVSSTVHTRTENSTRASDAQRDHNAPDYNPVLVYMLTTAAEPYCAHHILLKFSLSSKHENDITMEIQLISADTGTSKAKITVPKQELNGRALVAHGTPLCRADMVIVRASSSWLSLRRRKEFSGTLCLAELPVSNRQEMMCLPHLLTLSGSVPQIHNLAEIRSRRCQ
ncbi:phospholipase A1 member A isoform X2 [Hyla sarda]|uniref:phospholipase A1 member A isoform X2 n=1 Tax=Hyla sarda TaxID=327740 RepID=UPI0024C2F20D|nr:phospholipase A1 member A isoform X2 [Hyla sarda]